MQRTYRRHFHGPLGGANGNSAIALNASSLLPPFSLAPRLYAGGVVLSAPSTFDAFHCWSFARLKATADAQMTTTCFQFSMTLIIASDYIIIIFEFIL